MVLGIPRLATDVRGDHDLVNCSHHLQLANFHNIHRQQPLEKEKFECLCYYLATSRKVADFLS